MSMTSESKHTGICENAVPYFLLLVGILLATLAEALTGTALSFGRLDMWGDLHTTSDESAWLDVSYTAAKLCGFMIVPALFARFRPLHILLTACAVITVFSSLMICTANLLFLIVFRGVQGIAGGMMLVSAQSILFNVFSRKLQPLTQLIFAFGAVVAPATFVSSLEGWMVDVLTWEAIYLAAAALGMAAFIALSGISSDILVSSGPKRADVVGFLFFAAAAVCFTYIAQEGSRWNWFESDHIIIMTSCGFAALLACILRWVFFARRQPLVNLSAFDNRDFCFGFMVSFVAGMALFGSTWLIPGFTLNILGFTATDAGALNALGGVTFLIALLLITLLIGLWRVNPLVSVPLGILLIMAGMWLLSGSTSESGNTDLLIPLFIRGAGLGFLFLSLTIYALGGLTDGRIVQGVALFTTFRQFGGLFGVALLQRYLDQQNALNCSVLSSHIEAGGVLLAERLQNVQAALQSRGIEAGDAAMMAISLLKKNIYLQCNILSYNEAFFSIVILFLIAAPFIIIFKILLSKLNFDITDKHEMKI
jgi:DHA2 family multidrug resistance protein